MKNIVMSRQNNMIVPAYTLIGIVINYTCSFRQTNITSQRDNQEKIFHRMSANIRFINFRNLFLVRSAFTNKQGRPLRHEFIRKHTIKTLLRKKHDKLKHSCHIQKITWRSTIIHTSFRYLYIPYWSIFYGGSLMFRRGRIWNEKVYTIS